MIGIIDYGMGNLGSVENACRFLDLPARIITRPDELDACGGVILPGVGAFGDCLRHLDERGFVRALPGWLEKGRPFLGICVGLQALFESSEESPDVSGLGLLAGTVCRFRPGEGWKVPQMGWNRLSIRAPDCPIFGGIADGSFVYFVHSYHAVPADPSVTAATTDYGYAYASAVWRHNIVAVQFHPEKSQAVGLQMLRNFGAWVRRSGERT